MTDFTPLTAPPFRAQTISPALFMATETGNSPPLPTGNPSNEISLGFEGLIEKAEIVLEPAYKE